MVSEIFSGLTRADEWMAALLPPLARLCVWGLAAGLVSSVVYRLVSRQQVIGRLKTESRALRAAMLDPTLDQTVFLDTMQRNLKVSLVLLGHTVGPALVSALPVVAIAGWMASGNPSGADAQAQGGHGPETQPMARSVPPPLVVGSSTWTGFGEKDPLGELTWDAAPMDFFNSLDVARADRPTVTTSNGERTAHVAEAASIEGLLGPWAGDVFGEVPEWAVGWEFPFFLSAVFSGLAAKVIFRIE